MTDMSQAQLKVLGEMEESVMDIYTRMRDTCSKKCSNKLYEQSEIVKTEGVCMDRCVTKYMAFHDMIGKHLAKDKEVYQLLSQGMPKVDKTEASSDADQTKVMT